MSKLCYLYLMEDLCYGGVKIGISTNLRARKFDVQKDYETKVAIRYIYEIPDRRQSRFIERELHDHFEEYRADGEWFHIKPEDVFAAFPEMKFRPVDLKTPVQLIEGHRRGRGYHVSFRLPKNEHPKIIEMLDYFAERGWRNIFLRYAVYAFAIPHEQWPDDIVAFAPIAESLIIEHGWCIPKDEWPDDLRSLEIRFSGKLSGTAK